MSEKMNQNRKYEKYDEMSTEQLNDLLLMDSYSSMLDEDTTLYILEVIAKREAQDPNAKQPNTDAAWESFTKDYLPYSSEKSLYDFEDEEEAANAPKKKSGKNIFMRIAATAAIVVIVLFSGFATANAFGVDLWNMMVTWSKEVFVSDSACAEKTQVETEQLKNALLEYDIYAVLPPTYLPDGYEFYELNVTRYDDSVNFIATYTNQNDSTILIQFLKRTSTNPDDFRYQKSDTDPEIFTFRSLDFYLMKNIDTWLTVWNYNNIQGSITGIDSKDELIKIIESMEIELE